MHQTAWFVALLFAWGVFISGASPVPGQAQEAALSPGRQLLQKYAASDDTDAFLNEPLIRGELQRMLGDELPHLEHNLNVRGSVDIAGGWLTVSGNAPHMGTEEEAIVCVSIYNVSVAAAILSKGAITAYVRGGSYDNLPLCVKDWITLANSAHVDRMWQPGNVRMAAAD